MAYDGLDRLTSATSPMFGTASYAYDVLDNLTHVTVTGGSQARDQGYVYDASNRLTNITSGGATVVGLGYDVQGNLANKNGVAYTFDYGNRLRGVGNLEGYRYDVAGRRVLGWSPTAGNILSVYGQDGVLRFQQNQRNGTNVDYIYLGGSLVATLSYPYATGVGTVKYQHTDALGSPVAVTDANRTVLQRSEYEPYGYLLNRPMEDGPGYTGHVSDAATGLINMQQRYYDPLIGQHFLSVDPVTAYSPGGAFNQYWYANANPYGLIDPDGRDPRRSSGNEVYLASGGDWGSGQTVSAGKKSRSVPISESEGAALEAGDLKAFWGSRLLRGDPWGREGAAIWDRGNPALSPMDLARGELAVRWLIGAMAKRDGLDSSILSRPEGLIGLAQGYRGEIKRIGVAVAQGHAALVTTNRGNTVGLGASAVMHHRVFAPFGLPPTAYGGTPLFWGLAPGLQSYYINQIVDFCHGCPR